MNPLTSSLINCPKRTLSDIDQGQSKESWYRDNEFWKFHHVKGHTTLRCMQLKCYVKDLINQKEITIGARISPNSRLQIYENASSTHNKNLGKAPMWNNNKQRNIPKKKKVTRQVHHKATVWQPNWMPIPIRAFYKCDKYTRPKKWVCSYYMQSPFLYCRTINTCSIQSIV